MMVQAMRAKVGNPLRKLVLIKLADNASDEGECWPSYQYIADQCEISKRSVMNHIDALCEAGLIRKEYRTGPKGNASNLYILTFGGAGDAPGSERAAPGSAGDSLGGGAGAAPRTSHSSEPVKEPVTLGASAQADDGFELAWKAYPKREGANPKNKAHSAWKARLKDGVTAEVMLAGVARYAAYCQAKGSVGTEYVMQAQRFFGKGREFENPWTTAAPRPSRHTGLSQRDHTKGLIEREDGGYAF